MILPRHGRPVTCRPEPTTDRIRPLHHPDARVRSRRDESEVYTAVWLRWAHRRFRELTPAHGQRGAVATLLRESRGVTTTARLIRAQLRSDLEPREGTKA